MLRWLADPVGVALSTIARERVVTKEGPMKHLSATEDEVQQILVWESSFLSLNDEQKSLCIALHRNRCPMREADLANYLDCAADDLRGITTGIGGVLVDYYRRNYWIK